MTRLYLDVDPHGRVAPHGEEARRALADRAGHFALLPTAADLLLALRTPPVGGPGPEARCRLAGDLAGFPLADLVVLVHQSKLSGILTVGSGGVERSVGFKDGEVRSARSEAPGERIGEVAVRLGYLTEAQAAEAALAGRPIGRTLVERGLISAKDLWKCFHEQVTAVFHAILLAQEGFFHLADEQEGERPGVPLSVNTQSLLMDGIRRIDEMSLFRARIPGPQAFLHRREPRRAVRLERAEQDLLDLVGGRRRVGHRRRLAPGPPGGPGRGHERGAAGGLRRGGGPRRRRALPGRCAGLPRGRLLPLRPPVEAGPAAPRRRPRPGPRAGEPGRPAGRGAAPPRAVRRPGAAAPRRDARGRLLLPLPGRGATAARGRRRAGRAGEANLPGAGGPALTPLPDPVRLPFLTADLPGSGGAVKTAPEDFRVEEIPAYPPQGSGPHLWLLVEKRGRTTREVVRALATALDVPEREAGFAGLKDKQAVTTQWLSFPAPRDPDPAALAGDGFRVLQASRHKNKLRTGHLRGNRFRAVVRGGDLPRARFAAEALAARGLPNFYGPQRFGAEGDNAAVGRTLLLGRLDDPRVRRAAAGSGRGRRLAISAYQSLLFN